MKKLLSFTKIAVICLVAVCLLAACGGGQASSVPQSGADSQAGAEAPVAQAQDGGYVFAQGGASVVMGAKMGPALDALGEPQDVFEAPSCAFEGVDKIFYYPGFNVNTFPIDGEDYILSVAFMDDSVQTQEGVYLGMSREDVLAAYGESAETEPGALSYTKGLSEIVFLLEGDEVVDISYYYLVDNA